MQYEVKGANRDTGKLVTITVEAPSPADAQEEANELGILVSDVREADVIAMSSTVKQRIRSVMEQEKMWAAREKEQRRVASALEKEKIRAASELVFWVVVKVAARILFWIVFLLFTAYMLAVEIPKLYGDDLVKMSEESRERARLYMEDRARLDAEREDERMRLQAEEERARLQAEEERAREQVRLQVEREEQARLRAEQEEELRLYKESLSEEELRLFESLLEEYSPG